MGTNKRKKNEQKKKRSHTNEVFHLAECLFVLSLHFLQLQELSLTF
jgi:hypothetical protein